MSRDRIESTILLLLTAAAACGSSTECLALPCPAPPPAVIVTVTTPAGVPVPGAFVRINGAPQSHPCDQTGSVTTCTIFGSAGDYTIDVGASGFVTKTTTATYKETQTQRCGCPTGETARVAVVLAPSAQS